MRQHSLRERDWGPVLALDNHAAWFPRFLSISVPLEIARVAVSRRDEPEPLEEGPAGPMHVLGVWLSWPMGENSVPVKGTLSRESDLAPSPWKLKWLRNKIQGDHVWHISGLMQLFHFCLTKLLR